MQTTAVKENSVIVRLKSFQCYFSSIVRIINY